MKKQRAQRLFQSLTGIGDDLILEAQPVKSHRVPWLRWGAAAACLCLIAAGSFAALSGSEGTSQDAVEASTTLGSQTPLPYQHSNALPPPPQDTGKASGTSQADCAPNYAHTRDFSRQRQQLEEEAVIPEMADHPLFTCQARYSEDGSLYCLQLTWSRRGELEDYSDLSILAGYWEIEEPEDCIALELDGQGNPLEPKVTVTQRDGISITTEGRQGQEQTVTFQNDSGWYQIRGSWNDDPADVDALLDWLWAHPIDFQRFPMEQGDEYTLSTLSQHPNAFSGYLPDFAAAGYTETEGSLSLRNGLPVRYEGYYLPAAEAARGEDAAADDAIHWCLDTEADVYQLDRCIGSLEALTEEAVSEALEAEGQVSFTWDETCVTVFSKNAPPVWSLIAALQQR